MFEDMSKAVNILLAISLLLLVSIVPLNFVDPFLSQLGMFGIGICNLLALLITLGKTLGIIPDKK